MSSLRASVAVIGASGGIGGAIGEQLQTTYALLGIDRRESCTWPGQFLRADLCGEQSVQEVAAVISDQPMLHAVIFAAGTYRRMPIDHYDAATLERLFWDNFTSVFWLTKAILPRMVHQGFGRLVMISSAAATMGGFDPGYAATKGALVALMKSVAREYGPHSIRCNAVSPGPVDTLMAAVMGEERQAHYRQRIPIGRFCQPREVAAVVAALLADEWDAVNGATFDVDGGLTRR
jgi:NAD(P)-dependent dehydrogenase (short-subunit alcohol dehydrogenase family)